ncbi:MAG: DUF2273 domain-containing protein [Selenomonadaceae bacterium]|nr:DUF2273 domain-containing protein [Selenomonadaceae bacterium]MBR1579244.1 DUF2273 domain-containing protein [Selenomonadaceae bacterium]
MWEDLKLIASRFFETHRTRKQGFIVGLVAGAAILTFGFFNTVFAVGCGLVGLYFGAKLEGNDDFIDKTLERLNRVRSDKFRR